MGVEVDVGVSVGTGIEVGVGVGVDVGAGVGVNVGVWVSVGDGLKLSSIESSSSLYPLPSHTSPNSVKKYCKEVCR